MDIRFFCYRCFVFLGLWVGYEAQNGNQTTHQRTDDVEEAEGKIDQGRDAKNCTLRHTAIYLGMGIAGGDDTYTVLHTYIVLFLQRYQKILDYARKGIICRSFYKKL